MRSKQIMERKTSGMRRESREERHAKFKYGLHELDMRLTRGAQARMMSMSLEKFNKEVSDYPSCRFRKKFYELFGAYMPAYDYSTKDLMAFDEDLLFATLSSRLEPRFEKVLAGLDEILFRLRFYETEKPIRKRKRPVQ